MQMHQAAKLALTLFATFALSAGAIQGLHAQTANTAPAYVVAEVEVTDQAGYQAYLKKAVDSLKPYGATIIARGKGDSKEGAPVRGAIVIVAFKSMADAQKWYTTPPYKDLIAEREKAANTRLYLVDGVAQ